MAYRGYRISGGGQEVRVTKILTPKKSVFGPTEIYGGHARLSPLSVRHCRLETLVGDSDGSLVLVLA